MALANKLGSQYTDVKDKVKSKVIHIVAGEAEFDLKVRIPLKAEMESLNEFIMDANQDKVKVIYDKLADPVKKSLNEGGDDFVKALNKDKDYIIVKDDDIVIDGNSIKNVATLSVMWEQKVEKYFQLLISETGEPITETFEQITQEFPDEVIKQIVDEIEKAIKPSYDSVKKN